jgi:hypothetical protein
MRQRHFHSSNLFDDDWMALASLIAHALISLLGTARLSAYPAVGIPSHDAASSRMPSSPVEFAYFRMCSATIFGSIIKLCVLRELSEKFSPANRRWQERLCFSQRSVPNFPCNIDWVCQDCCCQYTALLVQLAEATAATMVPRASAGLLCFVR